MIQGAMRPAEEIIEADLEKDEDRMQEEHDELAEAEKLLFQQAMETIRWEGKGAPTRPIRT